MKVDDKMNIYELINKVAKRQINNIAIDDRKQILTYESFLTQIDELADIIKKQKIQKFDFISLHSSNTIGFIIQIFALAKLNIIPVLFNPNLPEAQVRKCIEYLKIKHHIFQKKISNNFFMKKKILELSDDYIFSSNKIDTQNIKYKEWGIVLFTSGTGNGIPQPLFKPWKKLHFEYESYVKAINLTQNDRILSFPPYFHAYGLMCGVIPSLLKGSTLYVAQITNSALNLKKYINNSKPSIIIGIPYLASIMIRFNIVDRSSFKNLRLFFTAGSPLLTNLAQEFFSRYKVYLSNLYGSTETGTISIDFEHKFDKKNCTAGKPIDCIQIKINQSKNDEYGEIVVSGQSVCTEYLQNDELSSKVFVNNEYYTGDLGEIDSNNNLWIQGRKSDFINIFGEKVDPGIIEEVLMQYPGIKQAVVVGFSDSKGGEEIRAFINSDSPLDEIKILEYCKDKLALFQMPKKFIFLKEFPRTLTGKVLKYKLKDMLK